MSDMLPRIDGFESGLFNDFRRLEREMDQLFEAGFWPNTMRPIVDNNYPPINVGVTAEQVDLYMFAAGVNAEKLDISINENRLTIKGERRLDRDDEKNHFRRERYDGAFHKLVTLPDDVDADKVDARYENGVLHIVIQRRESSKPRQIRVQ
jgi:HSP20 family protein